MKELIASKQPLIDLEETITKLRSSSTEPYGLIVCVGNQDFTITEVKWSEGHGVMFRHLAEKREPNVIAIPEGEPFAAEIAKDHATVFLGV